jgi:hypothetical protein
VSFFSTLKDETIEPLQLQLALLDEVVLLSRESYHFAFLVRFRDFFDLLLRHQRLFRGNNEFRLDVA